MTLASTAARADYTGSGSAGPFSYPFKIFAATDLVVTKRSTTGAETTLSYPTDYTVSDVGETAGGSVTLSVALATGEALTIQRVVPLTQPTDFRNQGRFLPSTEEDALDRMVMQGQGTKDAVDRSFKLGPTYDPTDYTVAIGPATEDGQVLGWSDDGLAWRTVSDEAVVLPGDGRTVTTLTNYLAHGAVCNVLDFGAVGDGVTNDAASIATAEAAAYASGGTLYWPAGKSFNIGATTLTIRCNSRNDGATVLYAGAGTAIVVGVTGAPTLWGLYELPVIVQSLKTVVGWAQAGGADVGVRLLNLYSARVYIPRIANFAVGLDVRGEGRGCVYNHIHVGHLDNNKVNQQLTADATGWSNENHYHIGRWSFNSEEGVNVVGTRDVLITAMANIGNNNHWWGGAHEGTVQEFHVECYGQENSWVKNRWESPTNCKVQFNSANAIGNDINGGYQSSGVIITEVNGAFKNRLMSRDYFRQEGSAGATGIIQLSNTSGDTSPVFVGLPAGVRPSVAVDTDRTLKISATTIEGKARGDVNARIKIRGSVGQITFNDGTLANPTEIIRAFSSDGIQHLGTKLGFFGATPVVKGTLPAAATDLASAITLANGIRTLLISLGVAS